MDHTNHGSIFSPVFVFIKREDETFEYERENGNSSEASFPLSSAAVICRIHLREPSTKIALWA